MITQHNLMAMGANRNYNIADKKMKKATEKLSSGYAINRASDDAAGLTISEKMRSQIRGLNQASKNLGDGIGYVQVADGALEEVQAVLHRVRELSVKSANDTNEGIDRLAIDAEVQELKKEIARIFSDTEFNGKKIWDENPNNRVQIGTETLPAVKADNITVSGILNEINKASIPSNGNFVLNADNSGILVTWDAYNGNSYTSELIPWPDTLAGNHKFNLSDYIDTVANPELSGIDFTYSYTVNDAASLEDVVNSINGERVYTSPYTYENTTIYTEDGSTLSGIHFSSSITYRALLASGKNFDIYDDLFIEGSVGGVSNNDNIISDPTDSSSGASSDKWSFEFEMPGIGTVKATSSNTYYYSNWKDPEGKWWGTTSDGHVYTKTFSPIPNDGSLDSVNGSLVNDSLDLVNDSLTGGTVVVGFNLTADSSFTLPNGDTTNNVGYTNMYIQVSPTDTIDTIFKKLEKISGIDIAAGNESTNAPSSSYFNSRAYNTKEVLIESPVYRDEISLNIQAGANNNEAIQIQYTSLNNHVIGINNVSLLTRESSEDAMTIIDNAQEMISSQRSQFGAYHNRMEYAGSNVDNMAERTQSSESRIRDADMAKEMIEFSKNKILVQTGQAMMAQANQQPGMVLQLLQQ